MWSVAIRDARFHRVRLEGSLLLFTPWLLQRQEKARPRRMDEAGEWHDDPLIMDERYVAVNVKGRGPVVLSACSHAGIINVLHDAAEVAGSKGVLTKAGSSDS